MGVSKDSQYRKRHHFLPGPCPSLHNSSSTEDLDVLVVRKLDARDPASHSIMTFVFGSIRSFLALSPRPQSLLSQHRHLRTRRHQPRLSPPLPMFSAEPPGMTDDFNDALLIPEELVLEKKIRNMHASARYVSTTAS